jgi:Co/Zn/Cd efflux system component
MTSCCEKKSCATEQMASDQKKVLIAVLIINAVMFVVELTGGLVAGSLSLTGDSLDMLGDAAVYAGSLYVVGRGTRAKAKSAVFKAWIILGSAAFVCAAAVYRFFFAVVPEHSIMSWVGLAALAANLICLALLTRHRNDDVNMSSVWLCSRNDIISNTSVLAAAGLVWLLASRWPDLIVGLGLTVLFTISALQIFRDSRLAVAAE